MGFIDLRGGTDRYVLFLKNPKRVYEDILEGHQQSRADAQVRKFLTEATPESALQDENKFRTPLRQLKDRNGRVRALGVWCQGPGYDLFIVQVLFDKADEDNIYSGLDELQEKAFELDAKFGGCDSEWLSKKADEWRDRSDVLLFSE